MNRANSRFRRFEGMFHGFLDHMILFCSTHGWMYCYGRRQYSALMTRIDILVPYNAGTGTGASDSGAHHPHNLQNMAYKCPVWFKIESNRHLRASTFTCSNDAYVCTCVHAGQGRAGQGRAGQGRAGQGTPKVCRAGQGRRIARSKM